MPTSVALEIFDNLHAFMHLCRTRMRSGLEAANPELTFNEARVLMHTGRHPGLSHKDLIERSHTDKAQMTRLLATLEARGWLTRTPSEDDKRVRCLHLSPQGEQLVQQLLTVQRQVMEELLQPLPPALQQALLEGLQRANTAEVD